MTKYFDFKEKINNLELQEAAQALKEGKTVIFPTETVYGIGANCLNNEAVANIFAAKGRVSDNPLIVHISNIQMLDEIVCDITELERKLMAKFWPGPLTIILKKKEQVPNIVTANLDTVGVRFPSNKIAQELISLANVPIAAPSANISGKPSGTNIHDIKAEFDGLVDYIIDGGQTDIGLESTVILVKDETINILRPGKITKEDLLTVSDKVIVNKNVLSKPDNGPVLSPGMKYRHYAPKTPCTLVYNADEEKLISIINRESQKYKKYLIITNKKHEEYFNNTISYGTTLEEISHNIFKILRSVDKYDVDMVLIEGVELNNLGLAIMNRLLRACSYNYIKK